MRAGNGQYAGGAGISEEDGIGLGGICGDWESQYSGVEVGAHGSRDEQRDGVGQRMQDRG